MSDHNFHAIIGPNGMCACGVRGDGTVVTCGQLLDELVERRAAARVEAQLRDIAARDCARVVVPPATGIEAQLRDLLVALERLVPPGPRRHHSLTAAQYASADGASGEWRLLLSLWIDGVPQPFFVDAGDLSRSAVDVLDECLRQMQGEPERVTLPRTAAGE